MKQRRRSKKLIRSLLLFALLCGVAVADSNLRLVTTEYALSFPNLPAAFDGFRIVKLSVLHGAVFGKNSARLLRAVREAKPDLIALTGDLADRDTDFADVDALLAALAALAPVYYVSGNHEWSARVLAPLQRLFERHGVRYLRNEAVYLERGGERIALAGVEDPNGRADQPKPDEVAATLPSDVFRVLLGHRNYWAEEYPGLPVDLILCGHAHGGVIRLPLLGGVLDHHGTFLPEYTDGVFTSGTYQMVVSRGLGNTGGVPRFYNNPEVVTVTLIKEDSPP